MVLILLWHLKIEINRLSRLRVHPLHLLINDLDLMLSRGTSSGSARLGFVFYNLYQLDLVPGELLFAILVHEVDFDWNALANLELWPRD